LVQVNVAVNQMDQMTQQNAAMVEETTAARVVSPAVV
jgi:methyl-accepting chemotaxis protein